MADINQLSMLAGLEAGERRCLQRIYESNLASLAQYWPDLYHLIDTLNEQVRLLHAQAGGWELHWPTQTADGVYLHLGVPEELALQISNLQAYYKPYCIYALCGVGTGGSLQILFDLSRQPVESELCRYPLYVLEPEPALFRLLMVLVDLTDIICSRRALFFVGEKALEQFESHLHSSYQVRLPTELVVDACYEGSDFADRLSAIVQQQNLLRFGAQKKWMMQAHAHYARYDLEYWHGLFAGEAGRQPRVLGISSRYSTYVQYSLRDLLAGFGRLGCETQLHIEEDDLKASSATSILQAVTDFCPDLVVVIDHLRAEHDYLPRNVPFMSWFQDILPGMFEKEVGFISILDFPFVFSQQWVKCFDHFYPDYLPLGVDVNLYRPLAAVEKQFDILYVSHLPDPAVTLEPFRQRGDEQMFSASDRELIESTHLSPQILLACYRCIIDFMDTASFSEMVAANTMPGEIERAEWLDQLLKGAGIPIGSAVAGKLREAKGRMHHDWLRTIKIRPLQYLHQEGFKIRVYGKNWDKVPELAAVWGGIASNGEELNYLMNQARVCLNNSPGTTFHMRAVEIMAAGCFMLTKRLVNDLVPISKDFIEGQEVVLFDTEKELAQQLAYYLSHDQERETIAAAAHQRVVEKFSFDRIARRALDSVSARLARAISETKN